MYTTNVMLEMENCRGYFRSTYTSTYTSSTAGSEMYAVRINT